MSNLKSFCKFNDSKNEKTIYKIKKYFGDMEKSIKYVIVKLENEIEKKNFLNDKVKKIRQNLKFIVDIYFNNFEKNLRLENYEKKQKILKDTKNLFKIFSDISFLFDRKNFFYENYFKMKSKLMNNKFDNNFNRTLENSKHKIEKMEKKIQNYNLNLIQFLEDKKAIIYFKFNGILIRLKDLSKKTLIN